MERKKERKIWGKVQRTTGIKIGKGEKKKKRKKKEGKVGCGS